MAHDEAREPVPHLRLVWSNPRPRPVRGPVNLALAVQHQLEGEYGLSDEEFTRAFALGTAVR